MRLRSSLLSGFLLCLMLAPAGGRLAAQALPRLLEDIKVLEDKGQEALLFRFSQNYAGQPAEKHGAGHFSLNFSGTGSAAPVRNISARESKVIGDIRVVQNKYSTTVTFSLKDARATMKGRLGYIHDGNLLRVSLGPQAASSAAPAGAGQEENLLAQMSKTITGQSAPPPAESKTQAQAASPAPGAAEDAVQPLGQFEGVEWMSTLLKLVFSLAAILGALWLVLWLYNRLTGARAARQEGAYPIKLLTSFHIGPKQRIVVLDIKGEVVACGVTASQISYLTRLGENGPGGGPRGVAPRPARPSPSGGAKPATRPGGAAAQPAAQAKAARTDPVQQFADALKDKVSSLKRIK